ncbi:hypothetical protein [Sphingomonas lenta]
MQDQEAQPNGMPQASGTDPELRPTGDDRGDPRSDLEQMVQSRSDAMARGEGGPEPDPMTKSGEYSGVSGDGGEVKNQGLTQQ